MSTAWFLIVFTMAPLPARMIHVPASYPSHDACWQAAAQWRPSLTYKEVEGPAPIIAGKYALLCIAGRVREIR